MDSPSACHDPCILDDRRPKTVHEGAQQSSLGKPFLACQISYIHIPSLSKSSFMSGRRECVATHPFVIGRIDAEQVADLYGA